MDRDLFLAILAMDAYHRGYGEGVNLGAITLGTTKIGNATITDQSDIDANSDERNAGFYAIAYDVSGVAGFGAAEKVIDVLP